MACLISSAEELERAPELLGILSLALDLIFKEQKQRSEAEFLDEIQIKVFKVSSLRMTVTSTPLP
jgi:hypothetical protein